MKALVQTCMLLNWDFWGFITDNTPPLTVKSPSKWDSSAISQADFKSKFKSVNSPAQTRSFIFTGIWEEIGSKTLGIGLGDWLTCIRLLWQSTMDASAPTPNDSDTEGRLNVPLLLFWGPCATGAGFATGLVCVSARLLSGCQMTGWPCFLQMLWEASWLNDSGVCLRSESDTMLTAGPWATESAAALEDGPLSVAAELGAKFDLDGPC